MGFLEELKSFSHTEITLDQQMKKYTSMGVGGVARYFARPDTLYSLNQLVTVAKKHRIPHKIIGNGTNVIVSDNGYNGLIICINKLTDVFFKRDQVKAMAGANLEKLIKFCLEHRLSGLEALSGIPATVGGAVVMNAGAFGKNISDHLVCVETLTNGKIKVYDKNECKFRYRGSRFLSGKESVISATFKFNECEREIIQATVKNFTDLRRSIQPIGRSCGSVFKNFKSVSAGELIDKAGLKGCRIGGAVVSNKHANFIINEGKATTSDVYALIKLIKESVKREFDLNLTEEVEFIGEI